MLLVLIPGLHLSSLCDTPQKTLVKYWLFQHLTLTSHRLFHLLIMTKAYNFRWSPACTGTTANTRQQSALEYIGASPVECSTAACAFTTSEYASVLLRYALVWFLLPLFPFFQGYLDKRSWFTHTILTFLPLPHMNLGHCLLPPKHHTVRAQPDVFSQQMLTAAPAQSPRWHLAPFFCWGSHLLLQSALTKKKRINN